MENKEITRQGLDLSILDKLSPEEKTLALKILKEYSQNGSSQKFNDLLLEDYTEIPVSIDQFVDDPEYLGAAWHDADGKCKLYPYWRDELHKIFPDNLNTNVNNVIFSGSRGRGKAQPLTAKIFTKDGYVEMGSIKPGIFVYGEDGDTHEVLQIFPQGLKDVYRVYFTDGSSTECSDEHLWTVYNRDLDELQTKELKDIISDGLCRKNISGYKPWRYELPKLKPLKFEKIDHQESPLDIGKKILSSLTLLDEYLYDCIDNRIAVLKGLFCSIFNAPTFLCPDLKLGDKILFLIQSIGGVAKQTITPFGLVKFENIQFPEEYKDVFDVSYIKKKISRRICNIEYVGKKECQCIYIDSKNHLYLTDNLIVTHNTEVAILVAAYLLHRILCLKDPVAHFHMKSTEKIVFAFMNIKIALAEEIGISKFQNTIQSSPWFLNHGQIEGRTRKIWVPKKFNDQVAIDIKIGSQSDDLIGLPVYFCLDENTLILTDNGIFKIKDLENKSIKVPTISDNNKVLLSAECTVKKTIESIDECEIELKDGTILKCTPSHRFRLISGEYKEAQNLTEYDELLDFTPYGYVYKTINLITGKIYIGHHKGAYLDQNYIGNNFKLRKAIKKYGFNNFKCELLQLYPDKKSLYEGEKYYISKNNSLNTYNISYNRHYENLGEEVRQNIKMKINSIKVNHLNKPKQYYDVINANPYNNFLIKTNTGYICSHNCFFDEVSFQKNQDIEKQKAKANDAIDTALGGMKTRFIHNGKNPTMLVLASSKRSDKSFLEEHMKKKLKSEKDNVYISDGSVWQVKPKGTYSDETFRIALGNKFLQSTVIPDEEDSQSYIDRGYKIIEAPIDFKADFLDDIDRALCDFAGISSSSISKYISAAAFYELSTDRIHNPFTREILEIGNGPDDLAQYCDFFDMSKIDPALRYKPLFIHLDMSVSGDKTGLAGVFIKGKKPSINPEFASNDLFYSLAFAVAIKAPKGRQVSFEKNRNFIRWLKYQGFNIKGITADSFQSADFVQQMKAEGFPCEILSVDRVDLADKTCKSYSYFRSTIYEKRLEIFDHRLLKQEVTELERNIDSGKVDHPDGGCFTGETKVHLVDGRNVSFLELVAEYKQGKDNYVYSINLDTKKIEPKKILKAWKTKENQELIRVNLNNKESIDCTFNHKFMLRNGNYVEAKDLKPGDSLMPLSFRHSEIKVLSIQILDKRADVYDIEVADNHNFALKAGVFVHNSKDTSDAVCGSIFNASKHAEEFAFDYGEQSEQLLRANQDQENLDDVHQLSQELENELMRMHQKNNLVHPSNADTGTLNYSMYGDIIIL